MNRLFGLLAAVVVAPASAYSFAHAWFIQEVYTNGDGSVQFIELFCENLPNEVFLTNQTLTLEINGVDTNVMTFSNSTATDGSGDLSGNTLNKSLLIGTANLLTLHGVNPDYIIPADFLSDGSLNFIRFSANGDRVNLTNLPTNGVGSLDGLIDDSGTSAGDTAINAMATPTNFAGQSATIPEPATSGLILFGAFAAFRRRR